MQISLWNLRTCEVTYLTRVVGAISKSHRQTYSEDHCPLRVDRAYAPLMHLNFHLHP